MTTDNPNNLASLVTKYAVASEKGGAQQLPKLFRIFSSIIMKMCRKSSKYVECCFRYRDEKVSCEGCTLREDYDQKRARNYLTFMKICIKQLLIKKKSVGDKT